MKGPSDESIERFAMPLVEVTEEMLEVCRVNNQYGALVYELYKEALTLVQVSSIVGTGNTIKWERNQAICAGLLTRMYKYMYAVAKLTVDMEHDAAIQPLARCITESAVNVQYLLLKDDDEIYGKFVKNSLADTRELYEIIQENIKDRGGELYGIEQNMLNSIKEKCELSGLTVEEINPKAGNWGGSFRDKLTALEYDWRAYTGLEKALSHAIHGDWSDLLSNHLLPNGDSFAPNHSGLNTDGKLLHVIAIYGVQAARTYVDKWFDLPDAEPLPQRLDSVLERLNRVEAARPDLQIVP